MVKFRLWSLYGVVRRCPELFLPFCCSVAARWPDTWTWEKCWAASCWMSRGKFLGERCNWRVNHFTAVANASNNPKLNCLGLNSHAYRSWSCQRSCSRQQSGSDPLPLPHLLLPPRLGQPEEPTWPRSACSGLPWKPASGSSWLGRGGFGTEVGGDCAARRGEGGVVAARGGAGSGCLNPNSQASRRAPVCRCGPVIWTLKSLREDVWGGKRL